MNGQPALLVGPMSGRRNWIMQTQKQKLEQMVLELEEWRKKVFFLDDSDEWIKEDSHIDDWIGDLSNAVDQLDET